MKYGGLKLTNKEIKKRRKKADRYFASLGINPDTKGNMHQERILDRKPVYIGGINNALKEYMKIRYPSEARRKKLSGKVEIEFEIDFEGKTLNHRVLTSVDPELDSLVLKGIKSIPDNWIPALYKGEYVSSKMVLPFTFVLLQKTSVKGESD